MGDPSLLDICRIKHSLHLHTIWVQGIILWQLWTLTIPKQDYIFYVYTKKTDVINRNKLTSKNVIKHHFDLTKNMGLQRGPEMSGHGPDSSGVQRGLWLKYHLTLLHPTHCGAFIPGEPAATLCSRTPMKEAPSTWYTPLKKTHFWILSHLVRLLHKGPVAKLESLESAPLFLLSFISFAPISFKTSPSGKTDNVLASVWCTLL